jgi:hypothetical protein
MGLNRRVVQRLVLGGVPGGEVDELGQDRLANIGADIGHRNTVGPIASADEQPTAREPGHHCVRVALADRPVGQPASE